jgi:hypothetical protein
VREVAFATTGGKQNRSDGVLCPYRFQSGNSAHEIEGLLELKAQHMSGQSRIRSDGVEDRPASCRRPWEEEQGGGV